MTITVGEMQALVGQEVGLSKWFLIDQNRINVFAETTVDQQFIHVDPVLAQQTPFGGTIAHGFLTLSLLSAMAEDALSMVGGLSHSVNYGFNRIRFVAPVPSGANIRGRFVLMYIEEAEGNFTQTLNVTIEIRDADKPAIVAEWLTRHYFA